MAFIIVGILALFAAAVVVYPFVRRGIGVSDPLQVNAEERAHRRRREEIYHEIRALQLERQLGTLEETEYQSQLRKLRLGAARSLKDQEISRLEQELEEEVLLHRSQVSPGERDSNGARP